MRTQNEKNTQQQPCLASRLLYSFLSACPPDQLETAFEDMDKMFKMYLYSDFADDKNQRQSFNYSLELINELGAVVKAIPAEAVEKLRLEVAEKLKPNKA